MLRGQAAARGRVAEAASLGGLFHLKKVMDVLGAARKRQSPIFAARRPLVVFVERAKVKVVKPNSGR